MLLQKNVFQSKYSPMSVEKVGGISVGPTNMAGGVWRGDMWWVEENLRQSLSEGWMLEKFWKNINCIKKITNLVY